MTTSVSMGYLGDAVDTLVSWNAPCVYVFVAEESLYDAYRPSFDMFTVNTTVSDEFLAASDRVSERLRAEIARINAQTMQAILGYCQSEYSSSIGSDSSYTSEQWSDAMLDRNDYTLDSGDHIKVSTEYDYVYATAITSTRPTARSTSPRA